MDSTDEHKSRIPHRIEEACCLAAYVVVPLGCIALVLLPWLALLLGIIAFPLAVKGRIGGFIQLPLALTYIAVIVVAIVRVSN